MNAIEFVKKFGWGEFKELYQASLYVEPFQPPSEKIIGIKKSEIKELFEAFELIEKLGGVDNCKRLIASYGVSESADHLSYYLNLVEQCQ